jgi:nucleotide-binding universal stress UspA family protein
MKSILVHVADDEGLEARLQAAFDLARTFAGHLTCQQATPYSDYALGDAGMGAFPVTELLAAVAAQRDAVKARVVARLQAEGVAWDYQLCEGDAGDRLVEAARLADVVVLSAGAVPKAVGGQARLRADLAGAVAVRAPAPVLVVPVANAGASAGVAVTGPALIAWNGSQEAAVALRAALPMLRLASRVEILTVAEKSSALGGLAAATWLSRHSVHARIIERESDSAGIEATIRAVAAEQAAAWLVLGAYGHSRLRETLFGGVTRNLVNQPPLPLLMAH